MAEQIPVTDSRPDSRVADFASLLSRVYKLTDQIVSALETEDDPQQIRLLVAKTNILKGLAKMLPALQKAEDDANILDDEHQDLADWPREKLERFVSTIKLGS